MRHDHTHGQNPAPIQIALRNPSVKQRYIGDEPFAVRVVRVSK